MAGKRTASNAVMVQYGYFAWTNFCAGHRQLTRLLRLTSKRIALAAMGLLSVVGAHADTISVDSISFQTTGQSIGLGLESKTFERTVIDTGPRSKTVGSIDTTSITNPARVVYNGKLASCTSYCQTTNVLTVLVQHRPKRPNLFGQLMRQTRPMPPGLDSKGVASCLDTAAQSVSQASALGQQRPLTYGTAHK